MARMFGVAATELPAFRRRLLSWFRRHKRNLPWRRTRDPYHIWISEIMLQQTRVAAAIPYYERFLDTFPTVQDLARAQSSSVLRAWAGLGYYSRARNLHRAAREIMAAHGEDFPRETTAALKLPGIGEYTAAAILSIAYGEPLAALDGNVARVLARLGAMRGDLRQPKQWRRLQQSADALLARNAPGDWNEAMMELGATVCTPVAPRCEECPVARWCRAHALGMADRLPASRRKAAAVKITLAAAILLDPRGRTLMIRHSNGDGALFARLWQFPAVEAGDDAIRDVRKHLRVHYAQLDASMHDVEIVALAPARHTVTYREIRLLPFLVRVPRLPKIDGARTLAIVSLGQLAISGATRKIASAALRVLLRLSPGIICLALVSLAGAIALRAPC